MDLTDEQWKVLEPADTMMGMRRLLCPYSATGRGKHPVSSKILFDNSEHHTVAITLMKQT